MPRRDDEVEQQVADLEARILGTLPPRPGEPGYRSDAEVATGFWELMRPYAPIDQATGERAASQKRAHEIIGMPGNCSPFEAAEIALIDAAPLAGEGGGDSTFAARARDLQRRLNEIATRRWAAARAGRYGPDRAWLVGLMRLQRRLDPTHLNRHLRPWLRSVAAYAVADVGTVPVQEKAAQEAAQAPSGACVVKRERRAPEYVPMVIGVERWD